MKGDKNRNHKNLMPERHAGSVPGNRIKKCLTFGWENYDATGGGSLPVVFFYFLG